MTPEQEAEERFDQRCRKYLFMSGDDFRSLVARSVGLPDHPMTGHLLLMLGGGPNAEGDAPLGG